jgi:hypothetical protein
MGGLVLDIAVMFIFKSLIRAVRFLRSLRWKHVEATVVDSIVVDPDMGCPSVKVRYQIFSNGVSQQGVEEFPFFLRRSAKNYAKGFSENQLVVIRINSGDAREMLFASSDQHRSSAAVIVR